ncbi:MAG: hypothetical protein DI537_10145 [Stutzerimonas stutzeri]|nr:MAG: hypothetical protein DI537_10145 [Stutzerimonas stutzeri]
MAKMDGFSDERRCVVLYDGDADIQFSRGILALGFNRYGGLKDYQIRIDDGPIIEMSPSDFDKDNGLVILEDDQLQKILDSKRLRVRVTTAREGVKQRDLDMTGLKEIRDRFVAECPND